MSSAPPPGRWRPDRPLSIPLQTGDGFSMSLFMLGFAFVPVVALAAVGVLLLGLGHWIIGPVLLLVGLFLIAAFWSFPRDVWVARPSDAALSAEGFRVVGGYHSGTSLKWDELSAAASGVRDGKAVLAEELVAATRDGKLVPVAEGEELDSYLALLDVWRAAEGLEPLPADARFKHRALFRLPEGGGRRRARRGTARAAEPNPKRDAEEPSPAERVTVHLITCAHCGAAVRPEDSATTTCLYCGEAVAMLEPIRKRLRELASSVALNAHSERLLLRLLDQPSALLTSVPLAALALLMLAAWLFGASVFTLMLLRGSLTGAVTLCALLAPLLLTTVLALLASLVVSRRVAVRAVTFAFAAVAPSAPGKPCGCRVCGAPLPALDAPVLCCAYCASPNVVLSARPRAPSRIKDHAKSLEEVLEGQRSEQLVRLIFFALVGVPGLWGAVLALRFLFRQLA